MERTEETKISDESETTLFGGETERESEG